MVEEAAEDRAGTVGDSNSKTEKRYERSRMKTGVGETSLS